MILPPLGRNARRRQTVTITFPEGYCCALPLLETVVVIPPGQSFSDATIEYEYAQPDGSIGYQITLFWRSYRLIVEPSSQEVVFATK